MADLAEYTMITPTSEETILIVDDEETVRQTFRDWLTESDVGCRILTASDAESALRLADRESLDLAILDWNLGAGNDGLQLLEDLLVFNPQLVAILVTGYAHQATPLQAMRMGVRDYLDKNKELDRNSFLKAVKHQLEQIRPARRQRRLHQQLLEFRSTIEKIIPLVQTSAALNDPLPLPEAITHLFAFLLRATEAKDGVLIARNPDSSSLRVYGPDSRPVAIEETDFSRTLAGSVLAMDRPCLVNDIQQLKDLVLQPFEKYRLSFLVAALTNSGNVQVVLELFDREKGFREADRQLVMAAADFAGELFRQSLAGNQMHRVLLDAVGAALGASEKITSELTATETPDQATPDVVLDSLRSSLETGIGNPVSSEDTIRLAEAIRQLADRYGPGAVRHCLTLIDSVRLLLDQQTGSGGDTV